MNSAGRQTQAHVAKDYRIAAMPGHVRNAGRCDLRKYAAITRAPTSFVLRLPCAGYPFLFAFGLSPRRSLVLIPIRGVADSQGFPNQLRSDSRWQTEGRLPWARRLRCGRTIRRGGSSACKRAKDAAQARRLLAIAAVLDGASREEAAKIGGMDRQTLRDWVIRFNEQGPDGLINIPSPGAPRQAR